MWTDKTTEEEFKECGPRSDEYQVCVVTGVKQWNQFSAWRVKWPSLCFLHRKDKASLLFQRIERNELWEKRSSERLKSFKVQNESRVSGKNQRRLKLYPETLESFRLTETGPHVKPAELKHHGLELIIRKFSFFSSNNKSEKKLSSLLKGRNNRSIQMSNRQINHRSITDQSQI